MTGRWRLWQVVGFPLLVLWVAWTVFSGVQLIENATAQQQSAKAQTQTSQTIQAVQGAQAVNSSALTRLEAIEKGLPAADRELVAFAAYLSASTYTTCENQLITLQTMGGQGLPCPKPPGAG